MKRVLRSYAMVLLLLVMLGTAAAVLLSRDNVTAAPLALRADDHVLGSRDAAVKIFEYSEGECSYCKALHPVLKRVLAEQKGEVALVYRHFPLAIHQKSFDEAMALECVAEAAGDETFFRYLDRLYEVTPSNDNINLAVLPQLASEFGVEREKFQACIDSGRHKKRVLRDVEDGIGRNVDSVPHLIVLAPDGRQFAFGRSPSYEALDAVVKAALSPRP